MLQQFGQWECNVTINGQKIKGREIVLPLPVSVNEKIEPNFQAIKSWCIGSMYSNSKKVKKGLLKNSTKYNQWINAARALLMKGKLPALDEPVMCFITFVFDSNKSDADNPVKALFDSFTLSKCVIDDDRLITNFTVTKVIMKDKEMCVAFVVPKKDLNTLEFEMAPEYLAKKISQVYGEDENDNQRAVSVSDEEAL